MKAKPTTVVIDCEFISFDKFLSLIKVKEEETELYSFDACLGYSNNLFAEYSEEVKNEDTSSYQRKALRLVWGADHDVFKNNLYLQGHFYEWPKENLQEMIECATIKHLMNYGTSKYLVKIDNRTWMPANPDDFEIVKGEHGIGLACIFPNRTFLIKVMKDTYEDIIKKLKKAGYEISKEEYKKQLGVI